MPEYKGSCHCGAVSFSFASDPITSGLSCNCSYCERRAAIMLNPPLADADSEERDKRGCIVLLPVWQQGGETLFL